MLKFILLNLLTFLHISKSFDSLTNTHIRYKRIVGGYDISINEIPYLVSIQSRLIRVHQCGGSIIGTQWILTAAHCKIQGNKRYFVLVGSNSAATNGHSFNVIEVINHPKFSRITMDYDIALLKLDRSITSKSGGQIIQLPQNDDSVRNGDVVHASGWGWDENNKCDKLKTVDLDIIGHQKCNDKYKNRIKISENMICAARIGKDACQSDSGGPLTIENYYDGGNILIGIISWGGKCGDSKYPGVYTKVSAFTTWITETQERYNKKT